MTFVWKITCRRLQTRGALIRFADGTASAQECGEIEAHLARCPSCQAVVADALAVADLLKTNVPTVRSRSLAASGGLWAALESTIAATPQEKALPISVRAPKPRLQQFGQWLATPGALPFGAVAAATVVGMIWVHQRSGVPTEPSRPVSVAAADSAALAEISLLPSPASPKAMASAPRPAKVTGTLHTRSAPVAVATNSEPDESEIVPIKRRLSIRQTSAASPDREAFALVKPPVPRAPIQLAKASQGDNGPSASARFGALAPPAPAAAPPMPKMSVSPTPAPSPSVPSGLGLSSGQAFDRALPPVPALVQMARAMPAPASAASAASAVSAQKTEAAEAMSGSAFANRTEEAQDASAKPSLMDMALQQRRKRTLFSYATR